MEKSRPREGSAPSRATIAARRSASNVARARDRSVLEPPAIGWETRAMAIQAAEDLPKGPAGAKLAALAAVILIARLPFLLPGYGVDPDAWRIAADGRAIASSGAYGAAR